MAKKIKVLTDSTAGIPPDLIERYDISVIPLYVVFGSDSYKHGPELSTEDFYRLLEERKGVPKTSQPSVGDFLQMYRNLAEEADTIISIHLSRTSGTLQSAEMARKELPELDIEIVDSESIAMATGFLALAAARDIEAGASKEEVLRHIEALKPKTTLFFALDTVEYMVRSGHVKRAQQMAIALLNIKPIIGIEDGHPTAVDKARGRKASLRKVIELTKQHADMTVPLRLCISHANAYEEALIFKEEVEREIPCVESLVSEVGPIVAVHSGPGLLGIVSCPA